MSVKGFKIEDNVVRYDYNALDNKPETDNTLSIEGSAADAKAVGDRVSEINDAAGERNFKIMNGSYSSQLWTENNYGAFVKVTPGSTYYFVAPSDASCSYYGLKNVSIPPSVGDAANISSAYKWKGARSLASGNIGYGVIPSDVNWLYFYAGTNTTYNRLPVSIIINGIDVYDSAFDDIAKLSDISGQNRQDIDELINDVPFINNVDLSYRQFFDKIINASNAWADSANGVETLLIEIPDGYKKMTFYPNTNGSIIAFLSSNDTSSTPQFSSSYPARIVFEANDTTLKTYDIESDMNYMYLYKKDTNAADRLITDLRLYVFKTDPTLSISDEAADAKVVGDELNAIIDMIPDIDTTLTVSGDTADAKATGDKINELKDIVGEPNIKIMQGSYTNQTWSTSNYGAFVKVSPGASYSFTAPSNASCSYYGLKNVSIPPSVGDAASISTAYKWEGSRSISSGNTVSGIIPEDVNWLYFYAGLNTTYNRLPISIKINGIEMYNSVFEDIVDLTNISGKNRQDINELINDVPFINSVDLSYVQLFDKNINSSNAWVNSGSNTESILIEIPDGYKKLTFHPNENGSIIAFLSSNDTSSTPQFSTSYQERIVFESAAQDVSLKTYVIESDMNYMYIYKKDSNGLDKLITDLQLHAFITDTSLSIPDVAAEAKATGDAINAVSDIVKKGSFLTPYGLEPFQMSLFQQTQNLFSDFCYYESAGYYRSRISSTPEMQPRITATANWHGWLIRIKPNTVYTLGPLDFKLEMLDREFNLDVTIDNVSSTDPNTITSGSNSYWLCLTQRSTKDMSDWMMVEGSTYPSEYISGYPQLIDVPKYPDDRLNHITYAYNAAQLTVTYEGTTATITIPANTRIITDKGPVTTASSSTTLTATNAQFIAYDMTTGTWKTGNASSGHEKYYIGWVTPSSQRCFLLANYKEIKSEETKTIAFMGDSITAGVATTKCYHQFIHDTYGFTCLNYGYGGSGYYRSYPGNSSGKLGLGVPGMGVPTTPENAFTPNNVVTRLAEVDPTAVDCIVIAAGTNDWGNNVSIENFISGIEAAFDYCKTNFTSIPVLVMTPIHRRYDTNPNNQGKTLREYAEVLISECHKYGIAYVDTMIVSGLYPDNDANRALYFEANLESGLHPSIEGHKRMTNCVGEMLKNLMAYSELS